MCYEWTKVWQCDHGSWPQEAPLLQLYTVGQLSVNDIERQEPRTLAGLTQVQTREVQMRGACAYIEDVRILQPGYCVRCREEQARNPTKFTMELIWKNEKKGAQI